MEISGNAVIVYNASDLIQLSNDVSSGTSYGGTTVLLGDDIDFAGCSDELNPIGFNESAKFRGAFDGQGHTINNLAMNSSLQFVGLFGAINGTSFRNVVVDSSCSFLSTHNFSELYCSVGGIVGRVYPDVKVPNARIENCVNMASVTFAGRLPQSGETDEFSTSVGGVVGLLTLENSDVVVRNCVNYGEIKQVGTCNCASIGGVLAAAFLDTLFPKSQCHIENCANFGKLVHSGRTENMLGIGGIAGLSLAGSAENCVNYGPLKINQETIGIGKIIGGTNILLEIRNCYWTNEDDGVNNSNGTFFGLPSCRKYQPHGI